MAAPSTVNVGDEEIRLEPFSGRKAVRVIRTIEQISRGVPEILEKWSEYTRNYESVNVMEMDRATARHYYAPVPLTQQEPVVDDGKPVVDDVGNVLVRTVPVFDAEGKVVMGPDPLGHMTDADWEASGNKLRLPRSASTEEKIAAIFPMAIDLAEEQVTRLLALIVMSNKDLSRAMNDGSIQEKLKARSEELLDAPATDLLELMVTAGEMVDEQFTSKVKPLGNRLPNVMRLFGMTPKSQAEKATTETSKNESSGTKPTSSTDSPKPIDGTSEPLSTEPAGSSSALSVKD